MIRKVVVVAIAAMLVLAAGNALAAWGTKELENETIAVNFAGEVARGGYKIVATKELKSWVDQKKPMLIVDTMPYEDSYKKQHIPGAVQMEFPIPEMTSLDDKTKAALEKLLGPDKNRLDRLLLRFHEVHAKPQRRHVGREAGLQERLPLPGRNQGLGRGGVSGREK